MPDQKSDERIMAEQAATIWTNPLPVDPGVVVGQSPRIPQYPVLFLHGFAGFGKFLGLFYGRNWHRVARQHGVHLLTPATRMVAGVEARALKADEYIKKNIPEDRFHIVGHSMGGLDGRYLISRFAYGERVIALATIGTPHHGVELASKLTKVFPSMSGDLEFAAAWHDLETDTAEQLTRFMPDNPAVQYYSWAGKVRWWQITPLLWPLARHLEQQHSVHDGLVNENSARWGTFCGNMQLNHFGLVGWQMLPIGVARRWSDLLCRWVFDVLAQAEIRAGIRTTPNGHNQTTIAIPDRFNSTQ